MSKYKTSVVGKDIIAGRDKSGKTVLYPELIELLETLSTTEKILAKYGISEVRIFDPNVKAKNC